MDHRSYTYGLTNARLGLGIATGGLARSRLVSFFRRFLDG